MRYELAQQFAEFELPKDVKQAWKAGTSLIGSLRFTKMMLFANKVELTNDDIDYFMAMKPKQNEDETPESFRIRSKFAKALLKYRTHLYDYSVYYQQ
jgi:hypothetical protein